MIAILKSTALLPIMLTWMLLVSLTLAVLRIQPPIAARWSPRKWKTLRRFSELEYVLISGVVMTGLPMTVSWIAYQFLKAKYQTHSPINLDTSDAIGDVGMFSIVGLISAFNSWKGYERPVEQDSPSIPTAI